MNTVEVIVSNLLSGRLDGRLMIGQFLAFCAQNRFFGRLQPAIDPTGASVIQPL
jgi:hypothetical protein